MRDFFGCQLPEVLKTTQEILAKRGWLLVTKTCLSFCYISFQVVGPPEHENNKIFKCYVIGDCLAVAGLYMPYASMPQLVDVEGVVMNFVAVL